MNDQTITQISVVIPTCHRNDLLAKCLDCLAPGTQYLPAERYEVIVTDDGSRSTARQIVEEQYPWVRWTAGPRRGPAANRNHGAGIATGTFLAFTDDDCLPSPNWLAAFATATQPDVQVYEGKTTCQAGLNSPLEEAPINLTGGGLWSCNFMIRRSVFENLGGFDAAFPVPGGEDVDLRERLVEAGYNFPFVDDAVVDHPPRKIRWGKQSGALWESQILLWYKAGRAQISPAKFMLFVAKIRIKNLIRYPVRWHSSLALLSLIAELNHIARNTRAWHTKHYRNAEMTREN